ncbi:MAG TPA: NAD(P)-dependent alcohol dehydrogenase [Candidatus Nanopelagicales bacterium]
MRAIVQTRYGPHHQVLRAGEIPQPVAGPGQVLVRVRATSVHADVWHAVTGVPLVLRLMGSGVRVPKQPVPGTDLAGEVVAVQASAGVAPGDRVFGEVTSRNQWANAGTFAEYAAVDAGLLARIPDHLSFEQAAAVPTTALIALMNLRDQARIRSGQRVLVNGAAGGVGVWAVQLAKVFGAQVTAVDAPAKLDLLRELGADQVIDYTRQDFTELGTRYDLVFDIVSQAPFARVRRALEPDGTYVMIGHDQYGSSGRRVLGSLGRMLPLMAVSPMVKQLPGIRPARPRDEHWAELVELLAAGRIRPVVDERSFPLEQAVLAIDHLMTGTAQGRVVLTV